MTARISRFLPALGACLLLSGLLWAAQLPVPPETGPDSGDAARRISERMAALEREAERLAGEAQTLVGDLRRRQIARDLAVAQLQTAAAAAGEAERLLQQTTDRLTELELQRINALPDMKQQLVALYMRGRTGHLRILLNAGNLREFARATRAVSALASITERRIAEHETTIAAVELERAAFDVRATELRERGREAQRARAAADRAVAGAAGMIREIDSRRDLTAQYLGELQVVYDRLQGEIRALAAPAPGAAVTVPLGPFRGALGWPVPGAIARAFGEPTSRLGGDVTRNGIEISARPDTPVRAVHGGTVGYADLFSGFGTLVILDHGDDNYSLYGYLGSTGLTRGEIVESGAAVGTAGFAPAGQASVYFELRIDGRPVDPVEWLEAR
jgi:septal ring factor EnvC (AmiA/AmiB activator)